MIGCLLLRLLLPAFLSPIRRHLGLTAFVLRLSSDMTSVAATSNSFDLDAIVDGRRVQTSTVVLVAIAALALISDGFDLAAMGYIAPELSKEWHLPPGALVPAFSAAIIGMMIGGPIFGLIGDKYGRKPTIVVGLLVIGLATLATIAAATVPHFTALRFITGVGLGGVIPNVIALVAEVTPRATRGRLIVLVTLGIVIGIALPGLTGAWLVPQFGWRVLLFVGGALPLVIAVAALLLLPESIKYLIVRGDRDDEVRRLARQLRPDLDIHGDTRLTIAGPPQAVARGSVGALFAGPFLLVTPLLWICQATNQMANFFSLTWLPTLLQSSGATTAQASATAAQFSLGGLFGGILLMFVIDRRGVVPLVIMFIIGCPLVALMVASGLSPNAHALIIAGAGFCVTGIQCGITALLGVLYPTPIRSVGTGWTQAAGRVGGLAAPIVGGILLGMKLPTQDLTLAPAMLLAIGAVACAMLAWLCHRHFGGIHVGELIVHPPEGHKA